MRVLSRASKGLEVQNQWQGLSAYGALIRPRFGEPEVPIIQPKIKNVAVVGARSLPYSYAHQVTQVVDYLLDRGFHIASGGAIGADAFVLNHLVDIGQSEKGVIFSAWNNMKAFPGKVRPHVRMFCQAGGSLLWGLSSGAENPSAIKVALLQRNFKLVEACHGITAFLVADSRGTMHTILQAIKQRKRLVIFPVNCELPQFRHVKWVPLSCGGCWEGSFKAVYLK